MVQLGNESAQESLRAPTITLVVPVFSFGSTYRCSPLFGKCLSSILFFNSVMSPIFSSTSCLICILSLYRRTPSLTYPVTKLKPPPSRFLCDERASEFQFPSCFQCHTWISFFLFFFPSLIPTACILPFFPSLAFSHISYISCISPFSFIGSRSSRLLRYYISVTLSGANSLTQMCFEISWKFSSFTLTGTQGGRLEIYLA